MQKTKTEYKHSQHTKSDNVAQHNDIKILTNRSLQKPNEISISSLLASDLNTRHRVSFEDKLTILGF